MTNVLRAVVCVTLLVPVLRAQAPRPAPRQTFDVVSIKPTATGQYPPGMGSVFLTQPGGRFKANNMTAAGLISYAFKPADRILRPEQVLGGPDWMRSTAFEIIASTGTDISREELNLIAPALIRSMLEDRFKVKVHMETRQQPIYVLVKARADGRLGAQLRQTTMDCDAYDREQARERAANPVPPRIIPNAPLAPCSASRSAGGKYSARGITMQALANSLSSDRPVIDSTGLTGRFDVDLEWAPDVARTADAPPPEGPSRFTALQEQLGLKLESSQEQRPVVVVDAIERPTPD